MHTFRESASVSENASWHPNRDYRYHPSHNPIHGLNRRIIPLRFALLPYLHKGGSLSQRPRSLSLSLSRACASGFAYTPLLRTRHEAPPFPGLLSSGFAFGPLVHTTGVWLSNIERLSTGGPLGSPVSFSTVSAAPCHSRCATPLKPILVVRFFPARPPMTSEDGCLLAS